MIENRRAFRITTNATTTPVSVPCLAMSVVIACANAGTAWTLKIQDKGTPVKILIPAFTLTLPTDGKPVQMLPETTKDFPLFMDGGIDIITAGTTPGEVSVWLEWVQ